MNLPYRHDKGRDKKSPMEGIFHRVGVCGSFSGSFALLQVFGGSFDAIGWEFSAFGGSFGGSFQISHFFPPAMPPFAGRYSDSRDSDYPLQEHCLQSIRPQAWQSSAQPFSTVPSSLAGADVLVPAVLLFRRILHSCLPLSALCRPLP